MGYKVFFGVFTLKTMPLFRFASFQGNVTVCRDRLKQNSGCSVIYNMVS
jgi:hypothetical protein